MVAQSGWQQIVLFSAGNFLLEFRKLSCRVIPLWFSLSHVTDLHEFPCGQGMFSFHLLQKASLVLYGMQVWVLLRSKYEHVA